MPDWSTGTKTDVERLIETGRRRLGEGAAGQAAEALAQAATQDPANPQANYLLGNARWYRGDSEAALTAFDAALATAPGHVDAWINRGRSLQELGRQQAAEASLRQAVSAGPRIGRAWENLASMHRFEPDDPLVGELEAVLADLDPQSRDARGVHFALGRAYHSLGASAAAFGHYAAGNRLVARANGYDPAKDERFFAKIQQQFPPDFVERLDGAGVRGANPIFIVGMPRSGTTLVEQILAAHSQVQAGGERSDVGEVIGRARHPAVGDAGYPRWVPYVRRDEVATLGAELHGQLPETEGRRLTDKMPANFVFLGLLSAMLPEATFIHVRRDPVATCFSCFRQDFTVGHGYAFDLAHLGRHYRAYDQLMRHWQAVLPAGRIFTLQYEDLVAEPEGTVAALLDHCSLGWEDACLRFHETERAVRTASAAQVRQPLDARGIRAWHPYRPFLGPLFGALGDLVESS